MTDEQANRLGRDQYGNFRGIDGRWHGMCGGPPAGMGGPLAGPRGAGWEQSAASGWTPSSSGSPSGSPPPIASYAPGFQGVYPGRVGAVHYNRPAYRPPARLKVGKLVLVLAVISVIFMFAIDTTPIYQTHGRKGSSLQEVKKVVVSNAKFLKMRIQALLK